MPENKTILTFQEFTKSGDLNPNRTERFCANVACVDRKVDLQIRVECAHVIPHENFRYICSTSEQVPHHDMRLFLR